MSDIGKRLEDEVERIGGVSVVSARLATVRNTIYNWIQKGNVPANKLLELKAIGADVLYILTGDLDSQALSADEQELIAAFRAAPLAVKGAVIGALSAGTNPPGPPRIKQKVSGTGHQLAGRDVVNHQGVDIDVQGEARNRRK